ncbi:glucoamylase [Longibacter salinarum]|uniref:Glucoamylase n=1 Tax=Longibacter salinarum TaxID=1850348 RepID=A0A2A8CYM3_9BACT|nr:glycoside hydrolase family 15 protein [Longibacter salinarum]PEN13711.1 glucoamylase [Longibacter salinarum]
MSYLPIEDYGLIGNMHTAALVGQNGAIDWMCWPNFDDPSVFAGILDDKKGGTFQIAPEENDVTQRHMYWPDSNVLITRFLSDDGVAEIVDYMPPDLDPGNPGYQTLIRRVEVIRGKMTMEMTCHPAFDYARADHTLTIHDTQVRNGGAQFDGQTQRIGLDATVPLKAEGDAAKATFEMSAGDRNHFVLYPTTHGPSRAGAFSAERENDLFVHTLTYWRDWISQCTYDGRWRDEVYRSALVLKLMTHDPTGAMIASPTMSLPESIGSVRNWDYRYTWLRDAAFTVYGLLRIGFTDEAEGFMEWISERCHDCDPGAPLNIMYNIYGETDLDEITLDHLDGYRGSRPVRLGNEASNQLQLDIYGELMDAVYLANKYQAPISYDFWTSLRDILNWLTENYDQPDDGIWEVRSERKHFVYSKLMCWVAFDRGIRLAEKRSFPADLDTWRTCRDNIYKEVMERGWNEERQAFTQHYGSDALDASHLIMPLVFFMAPNDPRMTKTLDAIMEPPMDGGLRSDSLVYRYDQSKVDDGLPGLEGTFNMCTFWLVEALTRAGRTDPERLQQARLTFEKMLGYANPLGLYAEETGPRGEALGNFPQAFTHLSLISAAFNLDRTLNGK